MRFFTATVVALGIALTAAAARAETTPVAAGKARAMAGGCNVCHGTDGVATAAGLATDKYVPNLGAEPDTYVEFQLVYFRNGVRKSTIMNGMAKSLSDDDIRNLGAYIASLPAPKLPLPPDPAPEETALGAKVAGAVRCTNCHGTHLEGVANTARLAGQREDYLYKALRDFKTGVRTGSGPEGMADVVYPLGDPEMKALAHYLSRLR